MDANLVFFILSIVTITTGGWVLNNWIRMKHGYAPESDLGGIGLGGDLGLTGDDEDSKAENLRLRAENRELHDKLDTMQDRMVVLEKIVTDRGYTLSQEIEALRDVPAKSATASSDSGVPLNMADKEPHS